MFLFKKKNGMATFNKWLQTVDTNFKHIHGCIFPYEMVNCYHTIDLHSLKICFYCFVLWERYYQLWAWWRKCKDRGLTADKQQCEDVHALEPNLNWKPLGLRVIGQAYILPLNMNDQQSGWDKENVVNFGCFFHFNGFVEYIVRVLLTDILMHAE